jgi:hypothetical protein
LEGSVDSIREPGHGYLAVNRRNITHLRDQRDRAGLQQLIDVLARATGHLAHDAATLIDEARAALTWIDTTTPRIYAVGEADGIRPGDILHYTHDGRARESVVITTDGSTVTTSHGDTVAL